MAHRWRSATMVAIVLSPGLALGEPVDAVSEFYRGKMMKIIVPTGVGGSIALYGQLFADHFARHVPGNPSPVFVTMPGAGGVTSVEYIANVAPKDGTIVGQIMSQALMVPMMRRVGFEPTKFGWLGSLAARPGVVAVWHTSRVTDVDSARKIEATMAASGIGAGNYQLPKLANLVIGTKFKLVTGYKSAGEMNLALERGEVDGRFNYWSGWTSVKPDWIRDKKLRLLFRTGTRAADMPDIPALEDLATSEEDRQMVRLFQAPDDVGIAFYLAEGVPTDRVEALKKAFQDTLVDKDFLAEAAKLDTPIEPVTASKVQAVVRSIYETPAAVRERFKPFLAP